MSELFEGARAVAHVLLGMEEQKTVLVVDQALDQIYRMANYQGVDRDTLRTQLLADFRIRTGEATFLVNKEITPWLKQRQGEIKWQLWERYKAYMILKDPSFPVNSLDDLTDKILDKCNDPSAHGRWDRRGLVVGHVQSGKTSNYIGLINKAVDAGYKLIVVIAGIHNSLRGQTQQRIDEGFIGRNSHDYIESHKNIKIGVGNYQIDTEIYSYTSSAENGDFNKAIADRLSVPVGGKNPTILVIKKNKSVLENLIDWLSRSAAEDEKGYQTISNIPLLVIDDEADNASVNSGKDIEDIKTINRLIRTLLTLFQQNTFIGYTATPYANIYIPEEWNETVETTIKRRKYLVGEDLFPRDFIVNLPPPSNYVGATRLFGYFIPETGEGCEGLEIIRYIDDQEPEFPLQLTTKNKNDLPEDVPESLYKAIQAFILTCAIRRVRGQENKHNSMLVHVALYVAWIDKIAFLVNEIVRDYKLQIKAGKGPLLREIEELFKTDFVSTTRSTLRDLKDYTDPAIREHTWIEIQSELKKAVAKIEVRAVHGVKNTSQLDYHNIEEINYERNKKNGLSVIAVGGNRLARGITLEGLSVSYYLRTTRLYDALMQMGRWFGYRPGYLDLCRLYTTGELVRWYQHVTVATQEMRADFDTLAAAWPRKTPRDYQLKVRTHSGLLSITSASRMRWHEIIQVGFSGETKQTYEFSKKPEIIEANLRVFEELISSLPAPTTTKRLTWTGAYADTVITFLRKFNSSGPNINSEVLSGYLETQVRNHNYTKWTIGVANNTASTVIIRRRGDNDKKVETEKATNYYSVNLPGIGNHDIGLTVRNDLGWTQGPVYTLSRSAILAPGDDYFDLGLMKNDGKHPSKSEIFKQRATLQQGLLYIYLLDPRGTENAGNLPIVGFFVSFPELEDEEKVEFAARKMERPEIENSQDDDDLAGEYES